MSNEDHFALLPGDPEEVPPKKSKIKQSAEMTWDKLAELFGQAFAILAAVLVFAFMLMLTVLCLRVIF